MIKKIFFILVLFCFLNPCLADDNTQIAKAQKKADKTVNQIKEFREDIYGSLNLTQQQRTEIDTIDGIFYKKIHSKFVQNYTEIGKMLEMSKEPNCNIKDIKAKVKQIQASDKKYFDSIKKDYSKEFEHILTAKQKKQYNKLKKDKLKETKQKTNNKDIG